MTLPKCILCEVEITENNDSKEHVIPNLIGGKKKINRFICKICNNKSGDDWDLDLAKQLNPLSLFFNITRDRGEVPSQTFETTKDGKRLNLNADGSLGIEKPDYSESPLESGCGTQIQIKARSASEAKRMLKGVKRKYPHVDLEEITHNLESVSSYCAEHLKFNLQFGGPKAGRSIVKSALALAVKSGIPAEACTEATNYLKKYDSEPCFGFFYEKDLIKNRPEGVPLHCVSVKGCSETQQVIAYVEYFGVQRVILRLSSSYKGDFISNTYAVNPVTGEELDLLVELELSTHEIEEAYDFLKMPYGSVKDAFNKVLPPKIAKNIKNEENRVIEAAVKHAFENCGAKEGGSAGA